jgi:hypothetical protein
MTATGIKSVSKKDWRYHMRGKVESVAMAGD